MELHVVAEVSFKKIHFKTVKKAYRMSLPVFKTKTALHKFDK